MPIFVEQIYKMQRLEVSGAVRPIYESLGVKRLKSGYIALRFLNLDIRWRRVNCFTLRLFYDGTHWIEGWVELRAGLDALETKQMFQSNNKCRV